MKVLLILVFAVFALAAANPLFELAEVGGFGNFVDDLDSIGGSEGQTTLDEVKEKLKEKLHDFLHKIREALNGGNEIKDEILNKGKEIKEKFQVLKEQLDKQGKDFLETLLDHGRDYLKQILDKMGVKDKRDVDYHVENIMQADDDTVQKLKDKFQEIVKKVKDAIEQGKSLKDGLETLEKIRQKLKEYNIDLGDFGNEYLDQIKDKVKDYWKKLKDRLGVSKRNADIDVFGMVEELKKLIKEKFNLDKIKAFVQRFFGEDSELVETLKNILNEDGEKRLQKLRDFVKKLVGKWFPQTDKRSVSDVFEQIRDFFKDLNIEVKERFAKFGEWAKEQYEKGLEKGKNRLENIKNIAKEFLQDTRKISRDVAEEALDFFKEYKKDLGIIFDDIEVKVRDILKQD